METMPWEQLHALLLSYIRLNLLTTNPG